MTILIKCDACKLMFEGLEITEICPKCNLPYVKVVARYPDVQESYQETFALAGIVPEGQVSQKEI